MKAKSKSKLPVALDAWDGLPLCRLWYPNTSPAVAGRTILATKARADINPRLFPGWTHDVWCGDFDGYGRIEPGAPPLFRTLRNALCFAVEAYRARNRVNRK